MRLLLLIILLTFIIAVVSVSPSQSVTARRKTPPILKEWKATLEKNGHLHLNGSQVLEVLVNHLNVSQSDLAQFIKHWGNFESEEGDEDFCPWEDNRCQGVGYDGWTKFQRCSQGRNIFKKKSDEIADYQRTILENKAFVINEEDSATAAKTTGLARKWLPFPSWFTTNGVIEAFNALMYVLVNLDGEVPHGRNATSKVYDVDVQAVSSVNSEKYSQGEASPEGVHSDGTELLLVTFVGKGNVKPRTARTRIWKNTQPLGKYDNCILGTPGCINGYDPSKLLLDFALSDVFETIILLDRKVKHEVTPTVRLDPKKEARRGVFIMMARRTELGEII